MKDVKPSMKAICLFLVVCMTFISGVSTFAENKIAVEPVPKTEEKINPVPHKQYLEEAVIKLVQEGKLTKEKAEKILAYKQKRADEFSKLTKEQRDEMKKNIKRGSFLSELKQEGIITEAEALAIRSKLREMKESRLSGGLQSLLDRGVLTQNDIVNIRSYMVKVREERKAKIEKLRSMTPEQRNVYFKENKKERKDIITRMVEDKVITEEQAKEIRNAIPELNIPMQKKSIEKNKSQ